MWTFIKTILLVLFLSTVAFSQTLTREQKLQKINDLNEQIKKSEADFLLPDSKDINQANTEGFAVFRLMPRERYDHKLSVQGGGSYYSFMNKTNDYQKIAQIGLEQNYLKAGFAGADYGFIAELENMPLENITAETAEIRFLADYKPPTDLSEIRLDQEKSFSVEDKTIPFKSSVKVNLEHTYVLRSINFDRADILVAFKIHRKDTDGSLIIFWKSLKNFDKPLIARN